LELEDKQVDIAKAVAYEEREQALPLGSLDRWKEQTEELVEHLLDHSKD